jgi:hypothetical protein
MTNLLPYSTNTNTSKIQNSNLITLGTGLFGIAVGVMASLAMVGPMVHSQVAAAKGVTRTISVRPADDFSSCAVPGATLGSGAAQNGSVLGAFGAGGNQTPTLPVGSGGGGESANTPTFVTKLVGGFMATNTATISGNGAYSDNKIVTVNKNTTTISNDNDVHLTNNNPQHATSGDATSSYNTDSNADATSGTASNTSSASMNVSITN